MKLRSEFRLENLGFRHPHPVKFVSSQWPCPRLYVLWRLLWALFHVTCLVLSGATFRGAAKWFIYVSNWSYLLLTLQTVVELVSVVYVRLYRKDIMKGTCREMPWYLKLSWFLASVSYCSSLFVSILYWALVFKGERGLTMARMAVHAINSLYVLLNLAVTSAPLRVLHVLYPVLYGAVYDVFSLVYFLAGGTDVSGRHYIYRVLDWSRPQVAVPVVCGSTLLATPLLHLLLCLLAALRRKLHRACARRGQGRHRDLGEADSVESDKAERTDLTAG